MTKDIYKKFYDDIILPSVNKITGSGERYEYDNDILIKTIYTDYENYRKRYKDAFNFDNNERIDRHKVCACISLSILNNLPIKNAGDYLLNECLAVDVGIKILKRFNFTERYKKDSTLAKKIFNTDWDIVPIIKSDESYSKEYLKLLGYCRADFQEYKQGSFAVYISFLSHLFFYFESWALDKIV